eukprot:3378257-Prymnesium_polylepis.1
MHVRWAPPSLRVAPLDDSARLRAKRVATAAARASRATTAKRAVRAARHVLAVSALSDSNLLKNPLPWSEIYIQYPTYLAAATGRFNPNIGGTSELACISSPRGSYTSTIGAHTAVKCDPGAACVLWSFGCPPPVHTRDFF